jgi:hypothetical protein
MTRKPFVPAMLAAFTGLGAAALILAGAGHQAHAVELPAVANDMSAAFALPPVPDSQLPDAVRQGQENLPQPGATLPNQTRRVAHGLGRNGADVYLFPTTQGKVCEVITEATSMGTCVPSFRFLKGEVATSVYYGDTAPQSVAGLASNRVAAISVRVGDQLVPVTVARNTFFWQAPTSDTTRGDIKGLVVRWHDGRTFDVNLDFGDP